MNFTNSPLFWPAVVVVGLTLLLYVGKDKIIDAIADQVVDKLVQDYGPSPYGPSFDPDKIDEQKLPR